MLGDEADLTVLVGDTVVFMRHARLSHGLSEVERMQALVAETRRTLVAVANQLSSQRVDQVCVCGDDAELERLASAIEEQIKLPAILVNPLDGIDLSTELRRASPTDVGRFGAAARHVARRSRRPAACDRLSHPKEGLLRRAARCTTRRRSPEWPRLAVLIVGWIWRDLGNRDAENTPIANQTRQFAKDSEDEEERARSRQGHADRLERGGSLARRRLVWPEELRGHRSASRRPTR